MTLRVMIWGQRRPDHVLLGGPVIRSADLAYLRGSELATVPVPNRSNAPAVELKGLLSTTRAFPKTTHSEMQTIINPGKRFLMCRPDHFAVSYAINPWMEPSNWARDKRAHFTAMREWCFLYDTLLQLGTRVELVAPAAGLPDLVFTANAGVVLDRQVLLARFRHPERQREEPHYRRAA
jgi:hypothetical protein